jgi:organic radical activating enzyme
MSDTGEVKLPIAETFHSIQGEGQWVGTPMHFIRLAGCPVGRPAKVVKASEFGPLPLLPTGEQAMACATWDGRGFWCDTDYNKHEEVLIEQLLAETWEKHICLTGGEPLIHWKKLIGGLFPGAIRDGVKIHIETSGTVDVDFGQMTQKAVTDVDWQLWFTCAPKINCTDNMIRHCDELKLLVDARFHPDELTDSMRNHPNVFLCPVNNVDDVRLDNVERAMFWLQKFPNWRLSCQMHKFLKMR